MRGVFTLEYTILTVLDNPAVEPKTLMFVGRSVTAPFVSFEILGADVTNCDQAVNEQLEIKIARTQSFNAANLAGSTPLSVCRSEDGDSDCGALLTTKLGNCSADTSTYEYPIDHQGVPSLAGYHYQPLPEERHILSQGDGLGIILVKAPTAQFKCVVQLRLRAIGG
jgi:hypothetical protein